MARPLFLPWQTNNLQFVRFNFCVFLRNFSILLCALIKRERSRAKVNAEAAGGRQRTVARAEGGGSGDSSFGHLAFSQLRLNGNSVHLSRCLCLQSLLTVSNVAASYGAGLVALFPTFVSQAGGEGSRHRRSWHINCSKTKHAIQESNKVTQTNDAVPPNGKVEQPTRGRGRGEDDVA